MRYEKGHKEATRQRIVATAVARFKKDGLDSVGVADLMAEAGLTHGGFYSHFKSKEDLVKAVLQEAARHSIRNFERRIEEGGLEGWIRAYLRPEHRDHPERGCVAAALGSELSRHPKSSREAYAERLSGLSKEIESHLPATMSKTQKRKTAIGVFATLIGAMQLSRSVNDPELSDQILEAGINSALTLAQIQTAERP